MKDQNVVNVYGYRRYRYNLSSKGYVQCIAVQSEALLRHVLLVKHLLWMTQRFSVQSKLQLCKKTWRHHLMYGFFSTWILHLPK